MKDEWFVGSCDVQRLLSVVLGAFSSQVAPPPSDQRRVWPRVGRSPAGLISGQPRGEKGRGRGEGGRRGRGGERRRERGKERKRGRTHTSLK